MGYHYQVHVDIRHTGALRIFLIGPRGVVAYKAVNPGFVGEVKGSIPPAVAGMAVGATGPIAGDVYTEIVDGFSGFAKVDSLFLTLGECGRSFPQPVGTGKHLVSLSIVTAEALLGHLCGFGFPCELDQLTVGRNILGVAVGAAHRSLVPFLVTAHALPVMSALEPDSPGRLGVESGLVTGGTPGSFRSRGIRRPVVMTDDAIVEKRCVFLVHKPNGAVKVFFLLNDRVVQEEVAELHIFELQRFNAKAGSPLGKGFPEHFFD